METESSERKKEMMKRRSRSSGTRVLNLAVKRRILPSLSTALKKSFFGFSGISL
jgi:hypothetical protein